MCGIVGVISREPVNQLLYDCLLLLQHRGQDAAGIATADGKRFSMFKASGLVRDVFRTRNMRTLLGNCGVAQVRYPTAGSVKNEEEAQPFYVNAPYGIVLAHNGNLTNSAELKQELFKVDRRHINTNSDSEVLLNVLAHELQQGANSLDPETIFDAVDRMHQRLKGAYAVVAVIAGHGLLAFRDPHGIRPISFGRLNGAKGPEWIVASESVAIEGAGFEFVRDLAPGEALFIDLDGGFYQRQFQQKAELTPCAFEYVYLARPDSFLDGVSVYDARLRMGHYLAEKIRTALPLGEIDVVMPIPDSSRPAAMEVARSLGVAYREGFFKNRYVGRTFIMPGQAVRRKSVQQKLHAMGVEFKGRNVLLVDDSIVRGTTSHEIVRMARRAGANKVFFASAAAPVKYPNVYGIDMPTREELVAHGRDEQGVAQMVGADALVYQDLDAMTRAIVDLNPALQRLETSCFDGHYVTGDIDARYLDQLEYRRYTDRQMDEDTQSGLAN